MQSKIEFTEEVFADYEQRFLNTLLKRPRRKPWLAEDRESIIAKTKSVLGICRQKPPEIRERFTEELDFENYRTRRIIYESWPACYGAANLYMPKLKGKRPLIVICTGHGKGGKTNPNYQALARRLARQGAYVLISDNIGQGERVFMGHRDVVAPFYCKLSLQGLIVLETLAWINHLKEAPFVEQSKIGVCGNSGGGTLTLFLGALEPDLAALGSSGYPSTFWWIATKEKSIVIVTSSPISCRSLKCGNYILYLRQNLFI